MNCLLLAFSMNTNIFVNSCASEPIVNSIFVFVYFVIAIIPHTD